MIQRSRHYLVAFSLMTVVVSSVGGSIAVASSAGAKSQATLKCPKPYVPKRMVIGGYEALVCAGARAPSQKRISIPGDGVFLVGSRVQPGTYESATPKSGTCYWVRLRNTSGTFKAIIANNLTSGPSTVTILPGDGAFETGGCEIWMKVS